MWRGVTNRNELGRRLDSDDSSVLGGRFSFAKVRGSSADGSRSSRCPRGFVVMYAVVGHSYDFAETSLSVVIGSLRICRREYDLVLRGAKA